MRVARKRIAEVINERLKRGVSQRTIAREVAAYLMQTRRYAELNSIMRDVIELRALDGNVEATVVSAHELPAKIDKEVKDLIKVIQTNSKHILVNQKRDPKLIGGIKLNVVDKSLDLSIRTKVNRLKQFASEGGISG